jgi:phosphoribosylformimino-5-aminoimidazole carboxamide ribotide isomerase
MVTSFDVYPALDVLEGRCVRLRQGKRERVTVEGGDPAAAAARFVAEGARQLHLVDLDGAFSGAPTPGLLERVVEAAGGVRVQVGGGFRSVESIEAALAAGAARVVVGTAAVSPTLLPQLSARFRDALVIAIDAREGKVMTEGWARASGLDAVELAQRSVAAGVARLLVTATQRDGLLQGPDLALVGEILSAARVPVIAAGGIGTLAHVRAVRELGCEGVVVGSALWMGRFTLADALAA